MRRFLARKITRSELKDPSGLDPKIRELMKKLINAIETIRSKSLDSLLLYMNLNPFERDVLMSNFDLLLDEAERRMKKDATDYFGWAMLFAWFHYRQQRNIYWGVVTPVETPEGTIRKPPEVKFEMPPFDPTLQKTYNERMDGLMDKLRTDLYNGIKQDLDFSRINQWDSEKLNKKLDERFRNAEYHAKMIATTELQFAYNSFIIENARRDGFTHLRWITSLLENVCKECGPRHGKVYPIDDLPNIPLHPLCACAWEIAYQK